MNRGILPIVARLRSLQEAARFAAGGARIIADSTDRNPVAQLLRAANETVLGRSLQFQSSGGSSLTLDVSGRRILRVTDAEGLPGAESCLGVEVLEDEHKDDLIKLMQAVAAPRYELRVSFGPIGRGGEEVSVGLPVALLADLVLIELNSDEPAGPAESSVPEVTDADAGDAGRAGLAGFAAALGPDLIAWLIVGSEDDGKTSGPEEMVSHLQGFLEDEREALDQQLDTLSNVPGGAICVTLGATLVEGHSITCARLDGGLLLGVIEGDGTNAMLSAWRSLIS